MAVYRSPHNALQPLSARAGVFCGHVDSRRVWIGASMPRCQDTFLVAFLFSRCALLSMCGVGSRSLALRVACDENGKARPAAGSGGDVDAVTQDAERLTNDEETDAQTVASHGVKTGKGLEDPRNVFSRNSNARVVYIDPDF